MPGIRNIKEFVEFVKGSAGNDLAVFKLKLVPTILHFFTKPLK